MIETLAPLTIPPSLIAEAKQFLRIDHSADDDFISAAITTSAALGEAYSGQLLIVRQVSEILCPSGDWQKLLHLPVRSITQVESIDSGNVRNLLLPGDYMIDIDGNGIGWIRATNHSGSSRVAVQYQAGLAIDWAEIPLPLMQGITRLVAHLYSHRDDADGGAPPSAVTALWRPYRRMHIA